MKSLQNRHENNAIGIGLVSLLITQNIFHTIAEFELMFAGLCQGQFNWDNICYRSKHWSSRKRKEFKRDLQNSMYWDFIVLLINTCWYHENGIQNISFYNIIIFSNNVRNVCTIEDNILTHFYPYLNPFLPKFLFLYPLKMVKNPFSFLTFSGGIEMEHWAIRFKRNKNYI